MGLYLKRFDNRLPAFGRRAYLGLQAGLREAGSEILVDARRHAPFKDGGLRRDSTVDVVSGIGVSVRFWVEYASYQERGETRYGKKQVRNYSHSGTGKHFLENAGDSVSERMPVILKKHGEGVR